MYHADSSLLCINGGIARTSAKVSTALMGSGMRILSSLEGGNVPGRRMLVFGQMRKYLTFLVTVRCRRKMCTTLNAFEAEKAVDQSVGQ